MKIKNYIQFIKESINGHKYGCVMVEVPVSNWDEITSSINKEDISALIEWLSKDDIPILTKNKLTIELEKKWAKKIGTKYSVYVNSGSSSVS